MFIVLGATGHVGGAVARALRAAGEPVTAVVRDAARAEGLCTLGCEVAEADIADPGALRAVLRRGRRAFLLNPPGDTGGDSDQAERASVRSILAALDGSGLEAVVAQSTYGAQPGEANGDLGSLWELEEGLRRQGVPATAMRAAYHYSNWDALLAPARQSGRLPTMIQPGLAIPMAAPADLGQAAARMLREAPPVSGFVIRPVEGPRRLSPADVARAMGAALGREVVAESIPRQRWEAAFASLGFSDTAARSYARMTAITVDEYQRPDAAAPALAPNRGTTTIEAYVEALARAPADPGGN